jgi:hypothetical protein
MPRPTTLEQLGDVLGRVFTREGREIGKRFRPRPSDVIISPFAKCGTTWTQHVVHGLRTGGDLGFEEISDVVPWIEMASDLGVDLDAPQVASPRAFKSHLSYYDVPKGARYVCPLRDPRDALVSVYRFFEGWLLEPGSVDLDAFVRWRCPPGEMANFGYWHHLVSWWQRRHDPDVLLLCYEDMLLDLPSSVRAIAHFIGIDASAELVETVVRQSSREIMLAHRQRFDERRTRRLAHERAGIPLDGDSDKVTPGTSDADRYRPSPELLAELDEFWRSIVQAQTGLGSYAELRRELRAPGHAAGE